MTLGATPQPLITSSSTAVLVNGINTSSSTTLTLNGAIGGAGGFNKSGSGLLTLGTANNYAGDTQISLGTLSFTDNNQLGAASSRLRLNGGTLQLAAAPGSATTYTVNRATIFTASSTLDVANANATLQLSGPILSGVRQHFWQDRSR